MSVASDSPRGGLPPLPLDGRDKRSFQSALRKRDAEFHSMQQTNFDLQLKVHHLERRLLDHEEPRRESAEPEPDDFYNFGDADDEQQSDAAKKIDPRFHDDNPVVQALRRELDAVRADNERLVDKNHQLADALDDLREKNLADAEDADAKRVALHAEMQTLANQVEDLQSDALKRDIDVANINESLRAARVDADNAAKELHRVEQSETAMRAKTEGLRMQYDVTARALNVETKAKEEAMSKLAARSLETAAVQKALQRKIAFAEEAKAQNDEAAAALQSMQRHVAGMREERDVAIERLEKEREKGKIWTETEKQLQEGDLLLSGDGLALEQLVKVLQRQQSAYDNVSEYEPRWRERVLDDMNDCLRALYRSQREVEAKRQYFVDSFCATSGVTSHANQPPTAATAPVS